MSDNPAAIPGPGSQRHQQYKFSQDEMRVLKECNRDSFFMRCLPMGTILGVGTYMSVKSGYFRGHPRFGATPKVVVATIIGYFIGKISYQRVCAEKLMQLPNSQIGEMLRQRRKGIFQEGMEPGIGPSMSLAPFSGISSTDKYSDLEPGRSLDIDTTRPDFDGLDDSHRPSVDNPIYEEEMPPMQKHATSYEELRKQNREEYQQKRTSNYSRSGPPPPEPPQQNLPSETIREPPVRTNIYGDPI